MRREIDIIKGVHPGFYLDRKIKEHKLRKGRLAITIGEYPQTLTSITKGKRDINTRLALKLEKVLGMEEGTLMILQVYFDIEQLKKSEVKTRPNLKKIRPALFWDTRIDSIDWNRQYRAVIRRVYERGNEREKSEITKFYGLEKVTKVLEKS